MPAWITCDEVFDVLTRGPFPTGETDADAAVELHLAGCHECRCLAEALRPAVELLQESLDDQSLPAYRGAVRSTFPPNWVPEFVESPSSAAASTLSPPDESAPASDRAALRPSPSHPVYRPDRRSLWVAGFVRIGAACLLTLLMVGVAPLVLMLFGSPSASDIRSQLIQAPLPQVCRAALASTDAAELKRGCCINCHHPEQPSQRLAAADSLRLITMSCAACHE